MSGRSVFVFRHYSGVQADSTASQFLFSGNGRINSTKSPASSAINFSEPRLMSEVGTVREVVLA